MKLIESIASYTGASRRRIQDVLTDDVKRQIAKIARDEKEATNIDKKLLHDLIEMGVLREENQKIWAGTAIFFEEDIKMLYNPVFKIGEDLASIVKSHGEGLKDSSPNVKNFIGSIMGMGQGLHKVMKRKGLAENWQNRTGRFEKSKVDFNESCEALKKFGDDLQIKRIYKGQVYSSIIIGAGNKNYCSYLWTIKEQISNQKAYEFCDYLVEYLTDTLPLLIQGQIQDPALKKVAEMAGIDVKDPSIVITKEDAEKYQPTIERISQGCSEYIFNHIDEIRDLLRFTIVSKQGVPIENMMMNLWRYVRRAAALSLYANGFLTDDVPTQGSMTIFYKNDTGFFQ